MNLSGVAFAFRYDRWNRRIFFAFVEWHLCKRLNCCALCCEKLRYALRALFEFVNCWVLQLFLLIYGTPLARHCTTTAANIDISSIQHPIVIICLIAMHSHSTRSSLMLNERVLIKICHQYFLAKGMGGMDGREVNNFQIYEILTSENGETLSNTTWKKCSTATAVSFLWVNKGLEVRTVFAKINSMYCEHIAHVLSK